MDPSRQRSEEPSPSPAGAPDFPPRSSSRPLCSPFPINSICTDSKSLPRNILCKNELLIEVLFAFSLTLAKSLA